MSPILMKSLDLKLGDKIHIEEIPPLPVLQSVTLSVSCFKDLSDVQLHETVVTGILRMYHANKAITSTSRILLSCLFSVLQADVTDCSPDQGILSEETKIILDLKNEERVPSHAAQLKQASNILLSIKYTLNMKSVSSKLLFTNGVIVCGGTGSGKTTILHNTVDELNRLSPDSAVYVSSNNLPSLEWK